HPRAQPRDAARRGVRSRRRPLGDDPLRHLFDPRRAPFSAPSARGGVIGRAAAAIALFVLWGAAVGADAILALNARRDPAKMAELLQGTAGGFTLGLGLEIAL